MQSKGEGEIRVLWRDLCGTLGSVTGTECRKTRVSRSDRGIQHGSFVALGSPCRLVRLESACASPLSLERNNLGQIVTQEVFLNMILFCITLWYLLASAAIYTDAVVALAS